MQLGLLIIGDEILTGKREDRHFPWLREHCRQCGIELAWVTYLGDDRALIAERLSDSFQRGETVLSTGGIGSTPDDHTRQAAARALQVPLELHPEAAELITARTLERGQAVTPERLRMGEFPRGATLIPNSYNGIPGFSIRDHHFVPGFPVMAHPMIEWVLETYYRDQFHHFDTAERALFVGGLSEAAMTPLMETVERDFPDIRVFSLPRLDEVNRRAFDVEVGVKGNPVHLDAAFDRLRAGLIGLGGRLSD